ncbi:hypothetical protein PF004_g13929 [Phytophthora fragariae]|uniref:PiggyBac transposable element-derived protein domain-containing protein n=1 Tax=Phytophthora fragariae TaxID=53985 RepID=A0A6G0NQT0_9STRA|nr:hypothetical protein PF004_g13929 [Phytophthora fragariae]
MTNRLSYCKGVIEKKKSRPATNSRGIFKIARPKHVPRMTAFMWWDSRPVHCLCTGGNLEIYRVIRQDRAIQQEVPCPWVVKDFHAFMGGVDVHDQLRLQRYSIQRAVRFKIYFRSFVLGLIDLAIVNGYIEHKTYHKNKASRPLTHVKYIKKLHLQLFRLQAADMFEANIFAVQQASAQDSPVQQPQGSTQPTHAPPPANGRMA